MKQALLTNWTFIRLLRLALGIGILVQAILAKDALFGLAGLFFTGTALFNVGCCGTAGCAVPPKNDKETTKEIKYEEVV